MGRQREAEDGQNGSDSSRIDVEHLGNERPEILKSRWVEIGFCFSVAMSQVLVEYFVSGFNVLLPTLTTQLNIPAASTTWPASALPLTVGSFLLIFGRLADMYGGYIIFILGLGWLSVWSLIAGFSQNQLMLDFCRALQGLGPAAFLPSGVMLLGSIYRPGPRKNLVFGIYGACAPCGHFIGMLCSGLAAQFFHWGWYFWIGAILTCITFVTAYLSVPPEIKAQRDDGIKMDWPGAILTVTGLTLVVFAITDGSHAPQSWKTPYIYSLLAVGILVLALTVYVEGWIVETPLFPPDLFHVPRMRALVIALFFSYGTLGVYLFYTAFYIQTIMGATPLQLVAWFVPMVLGGVIIATVGGLVLHRIPGTLLLVIASVGWIIALLLFAIAPANANYWAYIFPSTIGATIAMDLTFNITNVFITTSVSQKRQGLAGALINSVIFLSNSFLLGFADVTAVQTTPLGPEKSYHAVFWFGVACTVVALVVMVGFVRIEKAGSEMTVDEKEEEEGKAENTGSGGKEGPRLQ